MEFSFRSFFSMTLGFHWVLTAALAHAQGRSPAGAREAAASRPGVSPSASSLPAPVVVVTLDGVRWQDVFLGVTPALARRDSLSDDEIVPAARLLPNVYQRMIRGGVVLGAPNEGASMTASGPDFISLPGYREIFLGRADPTCVSNQCGLPPAATFVDAFRMVPGMTVDDVAVFSSWEAIAAAASANPAAMVLSTGRRYGSNRDRLRYDAVSAALLDLGDHATAAPGHGDYRPDAYTAPLALHYLTHKHPRFLFVALGDPDEYAHVGDYRRYLGALRYADSFVGALFQALDSAGDYGAAATVWLTTDHGRANDFAGHGRYAPESARVFLLVAGGTIPARGFLRATAPHHLADIAPTLRLVAGLSLDSTPRGGQPLAEIMSLLASPSAAFAGP